MGAELTVDQQISYVDSFLMFDQTLNDALNPFVGTSNGAVLKEIRKSLVELKTLKSKIGVDVKLKVNG